MPEEIEYQIGADVTARVRYTHVNGEVWLHINTGPVDITPTVNREPASELRAMASALDAVFDQIDRHATTPAGVLKSKLTPSFGTYRLDQNRRILDRSES